MLVVLWCVPRSVSTAFEKMIWSTRSFRVVSEPCIDMYKSSKSSSNKEAAAKRSAESLFNELAEAAKSEDIFVKEMAYHAEPLLSDMALQRMKHVFLTRAPRLSIPSLCKMRPTFSEDQPGFFGQLKLLRRVMALSDDRPLVIDATSLTLHPKMEVQNFYDTIGRKMPIGVLSWEPGEMTEWTGREEWHTEAEQSRSFQPSKKEHTLDQFPKQVVDQIETNTLVYEEILACGRGSEYWNK